MVVIMMNIFTVPAAKLKRSKSYKKWNFLKKRTESANAAHSDNFGRVDDKQPLLGDSKLIQTIQQDSSSITSVSVGAIACLNHNATPGDTFELNSTPESIWGSYFDINNFKWGYDHDHTITEKLIFNRPASSYRRHSYTPRIAGNSLTAAAFMAMQDDFFNGNGEGERNLEGSVIPVYYGYDAMKMVTPPPLKERMTRRSL